MTHTSTIQMSADTSSQANTLVRFAKRKKPNISFCSRKTPDVFVKKDDITFSHLSGQLCKITQNRIATNAKNDLEHKKKMHFYPTVTLQLHSIYHGKWQEYFFSASHSLTILNSIQRANKAFHDLLHGIVRNEMKAQKRTITEQYRLW